MTYNDAKKFIAHPMTKKILSMKEWADKNARDLGYKNHDDLLEKTKEPTIFEGIPHITYGLRQKDLDRRTKIGKEKARFISKCGNEHLK